MKKKLLILIILSTLLTTGCWDMIEIDQRISPYSVGYDLSNMENEKYIITIAYPNIGGLGKNPTSEEKVNIITTNANSVFEAMHKITTRIQRPLYFKHLKALVLPEDLAKQEKLIREIVDGLNRDFIVNKSLQMAVSKESAQSILEATLKAEKQYVIEGALYSLLLNNQNSTMFTPITLTNFIENMDQSGSAIVPVASPGNEEMVISGGAIFKNYKFVGYIDPMENRAIAYLNNKIKQDGIDTKYKGSILSLMITNSNSKKKLENQDGNIKIKYEIEVEGHIHGFILEKEMEVETVEMLEDMQEHVGKELENEMKMAIQKIQKEYKVDAIFIADYIRKFHPSLWEEIKDNWEEIYQDIEIEVDVNMFIRRRGFTK